MKVWINKRRYSDKNQDYAEQVYHTDPSCHYLPDDHRERQLEQLVPNRRECSYCANEVSHSEEYDVKTCNACGESFKRVDQHIINCPER
jgi:hypothetical protein